MSTYWNNLFRAIDLNNTMDEVITAIEGLGEKFQKGISTIDGEQIIKLGCSQKRPYARLALIIVQEVLSERWDCQRKILFAISRRSPHSDIRHQARSLVSEIRRRK